MKITWKEEQAFSLVEILVALIAVSCISAALAPVITKKLKGNAISIGGGGIGGKVEAEFTMDCSDFSADCTMCFNDKCVLCTKECADNEYVNTPDCICAKCTDKDENCIQCTSKKCTKCAENYGLNLSTRKCYLCTNGQSSDGMSECADCPENYFCVDGNKTPCATNQFAPANSTSCTNCTEKWEHCAKCNPRECLECEESYRKKSDGTCMMAIKSEIFTTPGNHTFTVPGGVTEMEVTLASGGAGGGAGGTIPKTRTIVTSGNGGMTANTDNYVSTTASNGLYTWTVPTYVRGKNFKFTACGGGGGAGGTKDYGDLGWHYGNNGGHGAYLVDAVLNTTETSLIVQIGGGGGGGSDDDAGIGRSGSCALGGGGGGSYTSKTLSSSCGSSGNYGKGGVGNNGSPSFVINGQPGYDPMFGLHGQYGGKGGTYSGSSGNGSYFAGGGGYSAGSTSSGGGGGATLFRHATYAKQANLVAGGGGGGSGSGCPGGGGGGITGGNSNKSGVNGVSGGNTIFGSSYCSGGSAPTNRDGYGGNGKAGAMRIYYHELGNFGGGGGGAGQIVPPTKIQVTPGEILTITVGEGGAGGLAGHIDDAGASHNSENGVGAEQSIVSKITRNDGIILITSAPSVSSSGATGGKANGGSAGIKGLITNGLSSTLIVVNGFLNTDGDAPNGASGGMGGKTTIDGAELHCSPGTGGGSETAGGDATGYGGCGGGGGGAGANGGKGTGGYVKITYGQ